MNWAAGAAGVHVDANGLSVSRYLQATDIAKLRGWCNPRPSMRFMSAKYRGCCKKTRWRR